MVAYQDRRSARGLGIQVFGAMAWTSIIKVASICDEKKPKKAIRGIPSIAFIVIVPIDRDKNFLTSAFQCHSNTRAPLCWRLLLHETKFLGVSTVRE